MYVHGFHTKQLLFQIHFLNGHLYKVQLQNVDIFIEFSNEKYTIKMLRNPKMQFLGNVQHFNNLGYKLEQINYICM